MWPATSTDNADSTRLAASGARAEIERKRIHAIAQPRERRTIGKNMPQMAVAPCAPRLGATHSIAGIAMFANMTTIYWLSKTWPARAGVIFVGAVEQVEPAAAATIGAIGLVVVISAGKCALGACLAQDMILLRRKLFAPFGLGKGDVFHIAQLLSQTGSASIREWFIRVSRAAMLSKNGADCAIFNSQVAPLAEKAAALINPASAMGRARLAASAR